MKQILVDELDFDSIKNNIKIFLRGQTEFDGYDFEGSALTILLDILAYNTHYNLLYTNLAVNEAFLDSASKRSSVVSLAKAIGYTAKSVRSARATLSIEVTLPPGESPATLTIPSGTVFATGGDPTFYFTTATDYTAHLVAGVYEFDGVVVIEGTALTKAYTAGNGINNYVIPSNVVDTSTLKVTVRESTLSSSSVNFRYIDDLLNITGIDDIYFLKQREDQLYEVFFGNGFIGKEVVSGNVVHLNYLASAGSAPNGASYFTYQSGWRSDVGFTITATQSAYGGSAEEDIESVRFNAPRAWISQNRAVTAEDYEVILKSKYPNIESIHAWGGQDNVPKVYGKVFISAKPFNGEIFSVADKADMLSTLLLRRGVVSVIPEFQDPDYLNVELSGAVYYNTNIARFTSGQIQTNVRNTILSYAATLNKFDSVFRFSKLSGIIDDADESITSNAMKLRVRLPMTPQYTLNSRYTKTTNNPFSIVQGGGSFYSTRFFILGITNRCYIKDDGSGNLKLYSEDAGGVATFIRNVGTVDYTLGKWDIPSLIIDSLYDSLLEFVFYPLSNDVVSNRNMIVTIRADLLTLNTISDKIASGEARGGTGFIFSSSR
jgi:hypothetical protein